MASYATRAVVEEVVTKAVTDLSEIIADIARQVDGRFNEVETRQRELDRKFEHLMNAIDGFIATA